MMLISEQEHLCGILSTIFRRVIFTLTAQLVTTIDSLAKGSGPTKANNEILPYETAHQWRICGSE